MEQDRLVARAKHMGETLGEMLTELADRHPSIGDITLDRAFCCP